VRNSVSSIENERMTYINLTMDGLHNRLSTIYEALADREIKETQAEIKTLMEELKILHDSMEDDL
jgi:hypothetical protein